jgi:hypothetical protein
MSAQTLTSRLAARFAQFTPRERVLLAIMAAVLGSGLIFVVSWTALGSMRELASGNTERRDVILDLLAERDAIVAARAEQTALTEKLANNTLRLSSFIESTATRVGLPAPTEFNDRQTPREGGITAFETTATFNGVDLADFDRLMNEFRNTDELVFIQSVSIEPGRGRSAETMVAEVTLVTYRRSEGGGR